MFKIISILLLLNVSIPYFKETNLNKHRWLYRTDGYATNNVSNNIDHD